MREYVFNFKCSCVYMKDMSFYSSFSGIIPDCGFDGISDVKKSCAEKVMLTSSAILVMRLLTANF